MHQANLTDMFRRSTATWVNGLTPGRYYARAWVFRYVQTGLDGSTFQEYSFQVSANEWAGDIALPMDLRISSWINKTVHFHDNAGTLMSSPISTGAQVLVGSLGMPRSIKQAFCTLTTKRCSAVRQPTHAAHNAASGGTTVLSPT